MMKKIATHIVVQLIALSQTGHNGLAAHFHVVQGSAAVHAPSHQNRIMGAHVCTWKRVKLVTCTAVLWTVFPPFGVHGECVTKVVEVAGAPVLVQGGL